MMVYSNNTVAFIKTRPLKTLLSPLVLALGLSACQTTELPPPTNAAISQFATDIQAAAVTDVTIMNHCSALGGPTGSYAEAVRESWQFSNQELLAAAERWLNSTRADQVTINALPYSLTAIADVHDLSISANESLNLAGRNPNGQKYVCNRELMRIETDTYAELSDPRTSSALSQQAESLAELETGVADILTRWAHWPKPGRSYISLVESVRAQCPTQSRIITLENNWPHERYAQYCDAVPVGLHQCEWGACSVLLTEPPER
ncbi:hypothetical protein [Gilvimarinus polysaccharolyticus]|uniref:hypothetical protein n=1 Tax=Gilvimarinus polysaccharolyticus TaxID=863921 RepID=UPI000673AF54|nr:hypothetical protein [Gilvimarinus polysaccharolyticus]